MHLRYDATCVFRIHLLSLLGLVFQWLLVSSSDLPILFSILEEYHMRILPKIRELGFLMNREKIKFGTGFLFPIRYESKFPKNWAVRGNGLAFAG